MKTLLLLAVTMTCGLLQVHGNLIQFADMIKYITGKSAVLNYNGYGCHCGVGGKGAPKDETDRCCFIHDCCYRRLDDLGCRTKLLSYNYSKSGGNIICEKEDSCRNAVCTCDRAAAYCFAKHQNSYNKNYWNYPNLLCTGNKPSC
ncbi:phospholipase A2, membrane associated-like [Ochotona curzoniae]|uniref:phospholipase A2, membrane associated-like n=1 Tax=Ochotona curzoniae TaxID=130825 RepID=UPI001B346491|nr:phospholipase A2, membrane associated-like [Ochotona curzoniae]